MEELKNEMEQGMEELEGLDREVVYMRDIGEL
jgi:hypothetical protein